MIRTGKQGGRGKTLSSYLLSGVNIKKIVNEELSRQEQNHNMKDASIIKIGRRPIFKIHTRDKDQNSYENSLPNKSFKIRSFTKKMRDQGEPNKNDENCEIFEKVEYVRNLRAINNRIEVFNLSRLSQLEKAKKINESVGVTANIYSKMREIFKRDSSMKCKIGSQVLVKEVIDFEKVSPSSEYPTINLSFQSIDTSFYKQMANKIQVYFHNSVKDEDNQTLWVISLESLLVNKRKVPKSSLLNQEQRQNERIMNHWSQQTIELLKIICEKRNHIKIAFKVHDQNSCIELKNILQSNHLVYFCIFFPITRFIQSWNLYLLDSLGKNINKIVLLQNRHKIEQQFPILSKNIKILMITTCFDSFLTLTRTIKGLQAFLHSNNQQNSSVLTEKTMLTDQSEQKSEEQLKKYTQSIEIRQSNSSVENSKEKQKQNHFKVMTELISIKRSSLANYQNFLLFNRQLKSQKQKTPHTKDKIHSKDQRRRVLCEKVANIQKCEIESITVQPFNKKNGEIKPNVNQIYQNLMDNFSEVNQKPKIEHKHYRSCQPLEISDLEEIMNHLGGAYLKTKSVSHHISDLVRRNIHIQKQISEYLDSNNHITLLQQTHSIQYPEISKLDESVEEIDIGEDKIEDLIFYLNKIT